MLKAEKSNITSQAAHATTQQVGRKRIDNARSSVLSTIMVQRIVTPDRPSAGSTNKKPNEAGGARMVKRYEGAQGLMIDDQVVHAYLSLLAHGCAVSGQRKGVVAADPGFWQLLCSENWNGSSRYYLNMNNQQEVALVPTFFGPRSAGHWAALIIDNKVSPGKTKFVFVDSLPSQRQSNFTNVKELLKDCESDSSAFVLVDSHGEGRCSNDCGVFMVATFAHWVLREGDYLPSLLRMKTGIGAAQFGREWRNYINRSIRNGAIDLNDKCLSWMVLPNEG